MRWGIRELLLLPAFQRHADADGDEMQQTLLIAPSSGYLGVAAAAAAAQNKQ
jgi:hypothetical protein